VHDLKRERIATTGVFIGNGFGTGAWAVATPAVKYSLALSDGQLGLALLAFAIGALVAMQLSRVAARTVGAGRATAVASLFFSALLVTPAVTWSFWSLFATLLFLGAANGATDVLMNAHASAIERQWHTPIMSSFHAGWSFGGLAGAAFGGFLAASGLSILFLLLLPALIVTQIFVIAALVGLRPMEGDAQAAEQGGLKLMDRALVWIGAMAFLAMMAEGAVADWSAVYLRSVVQSGPGYAAAGYAGFAFAMAACRLVGDSLVKRFGAANTIRSGASLAAVGFAIVVLWPNVPVDTIGFVLVGLGLANVVPVIFSTAGAVGETPARGMAMVASAGYAGILTGPPLIGATSELVGLRLAFLVLLVAVIFIVGTAAVPGGVPLSSGKRQPLSSFMD
jgi:MFS family permease